MKRTLILLVAAALMIAVMSFLPSCRTDGLIVYNLTVDPSVILDGEERSVSTYKAEQTNLLNYYGQFAKLFLRSDTLTEDLQSTEYNVQTSSGSTLHINPTSGVKYKVPDYPYFDQVFSYRTAGHYDPVQDDTLAFPKDTDLSFMPRKQAEEAVLAQIGFLFGQCTPSVSQIFALDHKGLSAREKEKKNGGLLTDPRNGSVNVKNTWSAADDCYYIVMQVTLDDMALLEDDRNYKYLSVRGVSVEVCYGTEGIRYLYASPLYDVTAAEESDLTLISSEEAFECVKKKYESFISTMETTVKNLRLRYIALSADDSQSQFRLVPAWCAELQEKMTDSSGETAYRSSVLYFNAITGEQIL